MEDIIVIIDVVVMKLHVAGNPVLHVKDSPAVFVDPVNNKADRPVTADFLVFDQLVKEESSEGVETVELVVVTTEIKEVEALGFLAAFVGLVIYLKG